jgi:hypothetical protein
VTGLAQRSPVREHIWFDPAEAAPEPEPQSETPKPKRKAAAKAGGS